MKDIYKETKTFILITLAILIVGSVVAFEVIANVNFNNQKENSSRINIIFDI